MPNETGQQGRRPRKVNIVLHNGSVIVLTSVMLSPAKIHSDTNQELHFLSQPPHIKHLDELSPARFLSPSCVPAAAEALLGVFGSSSIGGLRPARRHYRMVGTDRYL